MSGKGEGVASLDFLSHHLFGEEEEEEEEAVDEVEDEDDERLKREVRPNLGFRSPKDDDTAPDDCCGRLLVVLFLVTSGET